MIVVSVRSSVMEMVILWFRSGGLHPFVPSTGLLFFGRGNGERRRASVRGARTERPRQAGRWVGVHGVLSHTDLTGGSLLSKYAQSVASKSLARSADGKNCVRETYSSCETPGSRTGSFLRPKGED